MHSLRCREFICKCSVHSYTRLHSRRHKCEAALVWCTVLNTKVNSKYFVLPFFFFYRQCVSLALIMRSSSLLHLGTSAESNCIFFPLATTATVQSCSSLFPYLLWTHFKASKRPQKTIASSVQARGQYLQFISFSFYF